MSNLGIAKGATAATVAPIDANSRSWSSSKSSSGNRVARLSWTGSAVKHELAAFGSSSNSVSVRNGKGLEVTASIKDLRDPLQLFGRNEKDGKVEIQGAALISKRAIFDLDNGVSSIKDASVDFFLQAKVEIQLVSVDAGSDGEPKLSETASIEKWGLTDLDMLADQDLFKVKFKVPKDFGEIGAFIMRNNHTDEFYLHNISLKYSDGKTVGFTCNSWVYPDKVFKLFAGSENRTDRVFFSNKSYLPRDTPPGLKQYREDELKEVRGNGQGERQVHERIYDYDVYNDLGNPDAGNPRPIMGGNAELPYPRRCRTGRKMTKTDPKSESPSGLNLKELGIDFYIPADEYFGSEKASGFIASALKGVVNSVLPTIGSFFDRNPHFDSLDDVLDLYSSKGVDLGSAALSDVPGKRKNPLVLLDTLFNAEGAAKGLLHFPRPQIISESDKAWLTDEEFGRQILAGLNPVTVQRVTEFPPKKGDLGQEFGKHTSLTNKHIEPYLQGISVAQAIRQKKLFTVDYHDAYMPYIERINNLEKKDKKRKNKAYAGRAFFFKTKDGAMQPIAIELSLPPMDGQPGSNRVFTPPPAGREGDGNILWTLAKIHFSSLDYSYHEIVSHWLNTHAVFEPFIIATRRNLSSLHPIYTLLYPLHKNTMMINAAARLLLINGGGVFEKQFINSEYSMIMSSTVYRDSWEFKNQALPTDLVKRGMAEEDSKSTGGVNLLIEDYPYAQDGLDLWVAMKNWITEYVNLVYNGEDKLVREDKELQNWWKEIREQGHGDKKTGWIDPDSIDNLVEILCILHWIAGPHHAAINFGQYAYAGFQPNRPAQCVKLIPEVNTEEYEEAVKDPMKAILSTMSPRSVATQNMLVVELLSSHSVDEEYIGKRDPIWTDDSKIQAAFKDYGKKISELAKKFEGRNSDASLVNRSGKAKVPYTLLYPYSTSGLTGRGVPNSISI